MVLPRELKELENVYKSLFSETFSCVSSPIQFAALQAYQFNLSVQQYVADSPEILKKLSKFIYKELSIINIQCTKSKGSIYMLISFNEYKNQILKLGITTSFDLTNYVLVNYKFAMLHGIDFGFEKEELFFRISFVDFDGKKVMKAFNSNLEIDLDFIKRNTATIFSRVKKIKEFIFLLKS